MLGVDSCVFLIFTTRVDQTNGSTMVKLILFEKSRVELKFVFSIFTTRVRKHFGNSGRFRDWGLSFKGSSILLYLRRRPPRCGEVLKTGPFCGGRARRKGSEALAAGPVRRPVAASITPGPAATERGHDERPVHPRDLQGLCGSNAIWRLGLRDGQCSHFR